MLLGPNPVTDKERLVIWKWAKEHGGIDKGNPIENVAKDINTQFFGGMAPQAWITDIISGRKTPFRQVTNDMWRKQYNRRVIQQQAREARELATMGRWRSSCADSGSHRARLQCSVMGSCSR